MSPLTNYLLSRMIIQVWTTYLNAMILQVPHLYPLNYPSFVGKYTSSIKYLGGWFTDIPTSRVKDIQKHSKGKSLDTFRGFLKWWYPTTMGFPTRNDHFVVFWGYHHFRKHPYFRTWIWISLHESTPHQTQYPPVERTVATKCAPSPVVITKGKNNSTYRVEEKKQWSHL